MLTHVQNWLVDHTLAAIFSPILLFLLALGWRLLHNAYVGSHQPFFGEYKVFHYSSKGDGTLVRGTCTVAFSWLERQGNVVKIKFESRASGKQQTFNGYTVEREGIFYIYADAEKSSEEITITIKKPITGCVDTCVGIMTGLSIDHVPCATHILFSRLRHKEPRIPHLLPAPLLIAADDPPEAANQTDFEFVAPPPVLTPVAENEGSVAESIVPVGATESEPPSGTETGEMCEGYQRTRYSVSLLDLIQADLLRGGDKLFMHWKPRGGERKVFEGTLTAGGEIEVLGKSFASPSNAAVHAMQTGGSDRNTENGWVRWKTAGGILLAELRDQHLARRRDSASGPGEATTEASTAPSGQGT